MKPSVQDSPEQLAILQVLARYCRGIDRLDRTLVENTYWSDSRDDHGPFKGTGADMAAWAIDLLRHQYESTTHFLGQSVIELQGVRASAETVFIAYGKRIGPAVIEMIGGRYADVFEKRDGEWRILRRAVLYDWRGQADAGDPIQFAHTRGLRSPEDASYATFAAMGPGVEPRS